jgi:hypothetical protein
LLTGEGLAYEPSLVIYQSSNTLCRQTLLVCVL